MKLQLWGITERGDPAFDRTFEKRLQRGNIIITKNVAAISDILLRNSHKIILHATITGYGGTQIEENVPNIDTSIESLKEIIKFGFPSKQIVLRTDPIIPTEGGIWIAKQTISKVLNEVAISRLRFSFIDIYPHVAKRFREKGFADLLPNKNESIPYQNEFINFLNTLNDVEFSSCAESSKYQNGCISQRDLEILGIDDVILAGSSNQRKGCMCPSNKHELLKDKVRCPHKCLYCYWYDALEEKEEISFASFFDK